MEYTDIGHECSYQIWLWSFDKDLVCYKTRKKGHVYDAAVASGRVDPKLRLGSIAFSPELGDNARRYVINRLVDRFPGVKFFVFGELNCFAIPLQEYYDRL